MNNYDISQLPIFLNELGNDLQSFINCLQAYSDEPRLSNHFNIEDVGFNKYTGFAYLILDNGMVIASRFSQPASFIWNYQRMNEVECDSYDEVLFYINDESI